ncbi:hypothetical protein BSKO_06788 [Bryopsis sp. KO-2023]|nr:hypothetical protein BSKO_06788 [Bryopsis sp. KO-2023]
MSNNAALGDLPYLAVYRVRPDEETEDVMVRIDGCLETRQMRLRSIHSVQYREIQFRNLTDRAVRMIWLNYHGNEVVYHVIQPHKTSRYRTFTTHPWIARSVEGQMRMMMNDSQAIVVEFANQTVEIGEPPSVPWKTSTHKFFPKLFRDAVRCVLLCHHRSRFGDPPSSKQGDESISLMRMGMMFLTRNSVRSSIYEDDRKTPSTESNCKQIDFSFGDLPGEVVLLIIQKMEAPEVAQDLSNGAEAAPDVKPVWIPEDVDIKEYQKTKSEEH